MENSRFKFRAWDKPLEKYIDFKEFRFMNVEFTFNPITKEAEIEYDKERYIVEQCTGLKDKNGKLIYEGDIIKAKDNLSWVVVFKNGCFFGKLGTRYEPVFDLVNYGFEVIGNIYENPELVNNETQAKQLYDNKIQAKEEQ